MKNKIQNTFFLIAIFSTNCLLAQFPDPDAPLPGDNNPVDGPINGMHYIFILMFFAMGLAFFIIKKKRLSNIY